MRIALALAAALLFQAAQPAQSGAPLDTEIYLADVSRDGDRLSVGAPLDVSNSPGYDNQPSVTPHGSAFLSPSVRGQQPPNPANAAASGSDIYRYTIASKA